jgi:hypothetical protein
MARSRQELFNLLAFYDPRGTWCDFVSRIDFTGITPPQICQVVLDRPPASIELAMAPDDYDAAAHFQSALTSAEFRQNFQAIFLQTYPDKARDVFIHVPKCAGTDLILNLGRRSVPLPKMLEIDSWVGDTAFLEIIAGLARAAASNDRLFAYGHMRLDEYVARSGVRPRDRIFTVLRDPIDLLISQANYAIGRLRQDPAGTSPDTAHYLANLDLPRLPDDVSPSDLKDLTIRALLNPRIAEPNRACFYLGRGEGGSYATAMEDLIIHNVEVTTTQYYDRWIQQRWGIAKSFRHNSSEPLITATEARRICADALTKASAEDQKLYAVVSWALRESAGTSISGIELARLIGAPLMEALPRNAIPVLADPQSKTVLVANMLVATPRKRAEMYLAPATVAVAGTTGIETLLTASFGVRGEGASYRLDGWASPEEKFTWTAASNSLIRLPPMPADGKITFRLVGGPFVSKNRLDAQHVELLLGGELIGACDVRDFSVLECDLPRHLLHDNEPVVLTLHLPDAALPRAVSGANDDRLLALAVASIAVLRSRPAEAASAAA